MGSSYPLGSLRAPREAKPRLLRARRAPASTPAPSATSSERASALRARVAHPSHLFGAKTSVSQEDALGSARAHLERARKNRSNEPPAALATASRVPYTRKTPMISRGCGKSAHASLFRFDSVTALTMFRAPPAGEHSAASPRLPRAPSSLCPPAGERLWRKSFSPEFPVPQASEIRPERLLSRSIFHMWRVRRDHL